MKKKLTIGILAHVDAGKTTLSEALLYVSGKLRALGRVDHKNTFLDTNPVERERGITVFSKQARFSTDICDFILLDTPGHVDLSAEAERTLTLLDYAILVISAPDGVQNHTRTLWQLLEHYGVPTFIFVNKTDIAVKRLEELERELQKSLSPLCVGFFEKQTKAELDDKLAFVHENFLDTVLSGESIEEEEIATLISRRNLFPLLFGAALRTDGIPYLLHVLDTYTLAPMYETPAFAAKVYKIARAGNTRLTYMKITGGTLAARDELVYLSADGQRVTEKVSQLRLYSGDKFEQVDRVAAGEICAVIGLTATYVGQGLGSEPDTGKPLLEPVLSYCIELPAGTDPRLAFVRLKELEEEEPSLHLLWNNELSQIEARLMGDIQIDLLKRLILDRFGMDCELDAGRILYKEKISARALGTGHFEPLRHYAEVQLLLEPQPAGTGLIFDSHVPENTLDLNWQRLILSHLYEKDHRGTLTGALLTDTKITLVAGRAHLKHTEGGDFREATLRAVRHGLMKAGCT
ncbi:MAG: TetM/TetW/TetO/TetS family tetracycline resistance ribosomal protection protein, partial [Clostridia bacterium]|nr:TetM/TetW/TetO/TetS family tetracycline resistance ribosomal protection protein [Clostridia bacterium]